MLTLKTKQNKTKKNSTRFGSTYTKIGMIQRLAWPLSKDDTQISEVPCFFKKKEAIIHINVGELLTYHLNEIISYSQEKRWC